MQRTFFFLLFQLTFLSSIAQLKGKVVSISDGDTFTLLVDKNKQVRIRLYGIDTPENGQPFGNVAKKYLSTLIFGKDVEVKIKGVDRNRRMVAITMIGQKNINELLLQAGLAWHFKRYDTNPLWAKMEEQARYKKIGLWTDPRPIPPWDWRRSKQTSF